MNKNLTQIFIKKIIEEYTNNKDDIKSNIIKPILNDIFYNISHYLYFIFSLLLLIIIMIIINFIFLLYYSKIIIKKL
jgi:hypothetical protein